MSGMRALGMVLLCVMASGFGALTMELYKAFKRTRRDGESRNSYSDTRGDLILLVVGTIASGVMCMAMVIVVIVKIVNFTL